MGKLDVQVMRHMTKDDYRVLTAVEMGMRNHHAVPVPLIVSIAGLRHGGAAKFLNTLLRFKLVYHDCAKYDGYRLTWMGYDVLALNVFCRRAAPWTPWAGRSARARSRTSSRATDMPTAAASSSSSTASGRRRSSASRTRATTSRARSSAGNWLNMSRLAAKREWDFLNCLHDDGAFRVPEPLDQNRHGVVMSLAPGLPLYQLGAEGCLADPATVLDDCVNVSRLLARRGLIHCDLNEFNLIVDSPTSTVTLIDFPQMISTKHPNAHFYFERDLKGLVKFFTMKLKYEISPEDASGYDGTQPDKRRGKGKYEDGEGAEGGGADDDDDDGRGRRPEADEDETEDETAGDSEDEPDAAALRAEFAKRSEADAAFDALGFHYAPCSSKGLARLVERREDLRPPAHGRQPHRRPRERDLEDASTDDQAAEHVRGSVARRRKTPQGRQFTILELRFVRRGRSLSRQVVFASVDRFTKALRAFGQTEGDIADDDEAPSLSATATEMLETALAADCAAVEAWLDASQAVEKAVPRLGCGSKGVGTYGGKAKVGAGSLDAATLRKALETGAPEAADDDADDRAAASSRAAAAPGPAPRASASLGVSGRDARAVGGEARRRRGEEGPEPQGAVPPRIKMAHEMDAPDGDLRLAPRRGGGRRGRRGGPGPRARRSASSAASATAATDGGDDPGGAELPDDDGEAAALLEEMRAALEPQSDEVLMFALAAVENFDGCVAPRRLASPFVVSRFDDLKEDSWPQTSEPRPADAMAWAPPCQFILPLDAAARAAPDGDADRPETAEDEAEDPPRLSKPRVVFGLHDASRGKGSDPDASLECVCVLDPADYADTSGVRLDLASRGRIHFDAVLVYEKKKATQGDLLDALFCSVGVGRLRRRGRRRRLLRRLHGRRRPGSVEFCGEFYAEEDDLAKPGDDVAEEALEIEEGELAGAFTRAAARTRTGSGWAHPALARGRRAAEAAVPARAATSGVSTYGGVARVASSALTVECLCAVLRGGGPDAAVAGNRAGGAASADARSTAPLALSVDLPRCTLARLEALEAALEDAAAGAWILPVFPKRSAATKRFQRHESDSSDDDERAAAPRADAAAPRRTSSKLFGGRSPTVAAAAKAPAGPSEAENAFAAGGVAFYEETRTVVARDLAAAASPYDFALPLPPGATLLFGLHRASGRQDRDFTLEAAALVSAEDFGGGDIGEDGESVLEVPLYDDEHDATGRVLLLGDPRIASRGLEKAEATLRRDAVLAHVPRPASLDLAYGSFKKADEPEQDVTEDWHVAPDPDGDEHG
ncbi:serine/threonine kinase [Aureococcus anophagefferens]|nr:serine/threonine kinase [Aureococcus anophagefferens]